MESCIVETFKTKHNAIIGSDFGFMIDGNRVACISIGKIRMPTPSMLVSALGKCGVKSSAHSATCGRKMQRRKRRMSFMELKFVHAPRPHVTASRLPAGGLVPKFVS